ncbi:MAG: choice-of-anchor D domain-containing protein, partial [Actinomycetota bacterium]
NPSSLSFASTNVGSAAAAQTITVTNSGTGSVAFGIVALTGTNKTDFVKSGDSCSGTHIDPGGTCAVQIAFRPTAAGARTATVSIADNVTGSPQLVALSGTGIGRPAIAAAPGSLAFGSAYPGTTSASQRITVSNPGSAPNGPLTVTKTGAAYAVVNDTCSTNTLSPGGTCVVDVTFTPTTSGLNSGTVTIASSVSPRAVGLTGYGDNTPPKSRIATANNSVLVPTVSSISGSVGDDFSSIPGAILTLNDGTTTQSFALQLSCGAPTSCTWKWTVPSSVTFGLYTVTVNAMDSAGNTELNGPSISAIII